MSVRPATANQFVKDQHVILDGDLREVQGSAVIVVTSDNHLLEIRDRLRASSRTVHNSKSLLYAQIHRSHYGNCVQTIPFTSVWIVASGTAN